MKRPETTTRVTTTTTKSTTSTTTKSTTSTTTKATTSTTRTTTKKNKQQGPKTSCIYHAKKDVALCVLDFPNNATTLYISVTALFIVFLLL